MNVLFVQFISGLVGGNLVGAGFKYLNLGYLGNSLTGVIGGVLFGQLLQSLTGTGGTEGASDMQIFLISLAGGALGGALMTAIAGWLKGMLSGRS